MVFCRAIPLLRPLAILALAVGLLQAKPEGRCYIGALDAESVTLVWGTVEGDGNTIGRRAKSAGKAIVQVGDQRHETSATWLRVTGLAPDTSYSYSVTVAGRFFGQGKVRTWPKSSQKLAFLLLGDWGSGDQEQLRLARRLEAVRKERENSGNPVRFVASLGDNIYGLYFGSGNRDSHWASKFFGPYGETIAAVPFYAVAGNHDGNESERHSDLEVMLDNFFTPDGGTARWYYFSIGGLAEFFALDTTRNQPKGEKRPVYLADGEQTQWLRKQISRPALPWRFVIMHHPPFTAGPEHTPFRGKVPEWMNLFATHGVDAVFSGHEHNLQLSEKNAATSNIRFVVAGSGGQLRGDDIRSKMAENQIALWADTYAFCLVEIEGDKATLTTYDEKGKLSPKDAQGKRHDPPFPL